MDIDALLITHCAPTLARLKIGSLLCFHNLEKAEDFQDTIEKYNRKYNSKGLYFRILFACPKRTLLYVYRPGPVRAYMTQRSVICFLKQYGYTADMSLDDMLTLLEKRFDEACRFPMKRDCFSAIPSKMYTVSFTTRAVTPNSAASGRYTEIPKSGAPF